MTIQDYQQLLNGKICKWCRQSSDYRRKHNCSLEGLRILNYSHNGGYRVDGHERPQWLYVVCPNCEYQWGLNKLGIPYPPDNEQKVEETKEVQNINLVASEPKQDESVNIPEAEQIQAETITEHPEQQDMTLPPPPPPTTSETESNIQE